MIERGEVNFTFDKLLNMHSQQKNWKLLIYVLVGFFIVAAVSFYFGTVDFHKYCAQAQSGDWGGALYNGPEHSGFGNCILNRPSLNNFFLFFGSYLSLFIINIYLVSKEKLKFMQYALRLFSAFALYLILIYILTSIFQTVHRTFDGEVWVGREPLSIFPIPLNFRGGIATVYGTVFFIFTLLGGPAIIWFLREISPKAKFIQSISRSFLLVFLLSIPLQLLVIFFFAMLNSFIFSSLYPRRIERLSELRQTPYAPVQGDFSDQIEPIK